MLASQERSLRWRASVALCALLLPVYAVADTDPLIEGARQCTQYFPGEEQKNNIPTHLLAAIATTESGRFHKGLGMSVPWPWTINVDGKGYYFNSKAEAIAQTQRLLSKGYQSIDVGCMQVNLKHHPKAFANLNQAFDPATNVSYAAHFLHDNYATLGDWIKATAAYHSRTPVYGQQYLTEIERSWNRIVGKVAEARASKAGRDGQETQATAALGAPATPSTAPRVTAEAAPRIVSAARPMLAAHHARVIQVSDSPRTRSEVMVVRATPPVEAAAPMVVAAQPVAVADASANTAAALAPRAGNAASGDSVRRVSLDSRSSSAIPVAQPAGPNFVFAN